jgi:hypothetical protein
MTQMTWSDDVLIVIVIMLLVGLRVAMLRRRERTGR